MSSFRPFNLFSMDSGTVEMEKKRRAARVDLEESDGEVEPSVEKSKTTNDEDYDSDHSRDLMLSLFSKSPSVKKSVKRAKANVKCAGRQFSIRKRDKKAHLNPQCALCESHSSTATGYVHHLAKSHNTTLIARGIYLVCGCGTEVRSRTANPNHTKCVSRTFTLHKDEKGTPKCTMCETYPSTPAGFAHHLKRQHNSTLKENGIFLLCACGKEIRSITYDPNHKKCDGFRFSLHKLDTPSGKLPRRSLRSAPAIRTRSVVREREGFSDIDEEEEEDNDDDEEQEEVQNDGEDTVAAEGEAERVEENAQMAEAIFVDQEKQEGYKKGGYHPVNIGDVFNDKYHVTRKLGYGIFSTVWLCQDATKNRSVALKVVKSDYSHSAEIELLRRVRYANTSDPHRSKIVQLLDYFAILGVNGKHTCMVFEPLHCNVLQLIRQLPITAHGLGIRKTKTITRQVLEGLNYLHTKCQIIHTDIKPENILVTLENDEVKQAKIADLGNACWTHQHFSDEIQTKEYKAPEVLIGVDYGTSVDIWSIACVTYEMITESYLFAPKEGEEGRVGRLWSRGPNYTCEADHVALITKAVGLIPSGVYKSGTHWNNFFNENGELLHVGKSTFSLAEQRRKFGKKRFIAQIMDFLDAALVLDPRSRATAAQCLQFEMFRQQQQPAAAAVEEEESGQEEMMDEEDQRPGPSGTN